MLVAGCTNSGFAECGSPESKELIDKLLKEELEYGIQNQIDAQKELGSYDSTELENAVERLKISLNDVRTSRDDPDSQRFSCRATLALELPETVEKKANETRSMAEMGSVRDLANRYKMKRRGRTYTTEFDYFIQPTDDGEKLFAEMDDDAPALKFLGETLASYLLSDEIREEKIAEDQAIAAELAEERARENAQKEREREIDSAFAAEGDAALNAAEVQRKLASERINAVWLAMPADIQRDLDDLHSAWVKQMKARCASEAAGSDERSSMRKAKELNCQTRLVRSCANTLNRNVGSTSSRMRYCRF
ncbi:hypothetical protein GRI41_13795 [Altererythrobacter aquaemixtae]|uniref:Lysozyme inhibitor LprI N-terminal domain-containing protein n=2 Tax=Pontixanthobacter aquaemixtae TaxID=1958940 RepID=A0A844ZV60_9SPHN|nr:hypothetical protein [Pontixanthobacter aquaemixtae]